MSELKMCPFCWGNEVELYESCGMAIIECKRCHTHSKGYSSHAAAIEAWNTRPREAELEQLANDIMAWAYGLALGARTNAAEVAYYENRMLRRNGFGVMRNEHG